MTQGIQVAKLTDLVCWADLITLGIPRFPSIAQTNRPLSARFLQVP